MHLHETELRGNIAAASLAVIIQVMKTTGQLQCEVPNANLHHFKGRFQFLAEDESKLSQTWLATCVSIYSHHVLPVHSC